MVNPLSGVTSWIYHLGDVNQTRAKTIGDSQAGLVVVDYAHGSMKPYSPAELDVMRGANDKLVVSYLSVGEAEDYRPYWQNSWNNNPPDWLSAANPEWKDNYKVRYWDPDWQEIVFNAVDDVVEAGFNGLYLDIIDAYWFWEEETNVSGIDFRSEMAEFVAAIRARAEKKLAELGDDRPFVIIGQNGEELIDNATYLAAVDGVGKEDLRFYYPNGRESSFKPVPEGWYGPSKKFLEKAEKAGVEVFVVEYMTKARQAEYASMLEDLYDYLKSAGMPLYISEDRDLEDIYDQPFPPIPGDEDPPVEKTGTPGNDVLKGTAADDTLSGLAGDDTLIGGAGGDTLFGGRGKDAASYANAKAGVVADLSSPAGNAGDAANDVYKSIESVIGSAHADSLLGSRAANVIHGGKRADTISGRDRGDELYGEAGRDKIDGGKGRDIVDGGEGRDTLAGNGGADRFVLRSAADSTVKKSGRDIIVDFSRKQGDLIDLGAIDARSSSVLNDGFDFLGSSPFSGREGELRYEVRGGSTFVYGDIDGDGSADFAIELVGVHALTVADFIL